MGTTLAAAMGARGYDTHFCNRGPAKHERTTIKQRFLALKDAIIPLLMPVIILGPILHPIAVSIGIAPIHFGIIMVLSLNMALMTPPVGACLFVACSITKLTLAQISRAILPFIVVEFLALFVIAYSPRNVLFLPTLLGFY